MTPPTAPLRIAWTGHRPSLFADVGAAQHAVDRLARSVVAEHVGRPLRFLVGGQRGVDTWAALAARGLGTLYDVILPLDVPPFTHDWDPEDRALLEQTLLDADRVEVVGGDPAAAYSERNRRLATRADLLLAVWTGQRGGGTWETIAFARAAGTPLREILLAGSAAGSAAAGERGI